MHTANRRSSRRAALLLALLIFGASCGEPAPNPNIERFVVPSGASLQQVSDTLSSRGIVRFPALFRMYVRMKGADSDIKAGTYELGQSSKWSEILDVLVSGRVVTLAFTIPEGWTIIQIAERLAPIVEDSAEAISQRLLDTALTDSLGAPGPTLEGYLFPETYRFAAGVPVERVAAELFQSYRNFWSRGRRERLDSIGMSEREIVTLASIVQAEARWEDEMPIIAAVYHNRLKRGMRLQADPTVQYALDSRKTRLLFQDIEAVADHPYNTYTHAGLPPGPIGSPGAAAIDASLNPAQVPFLYFVARDDGRHEFSRTLVEHNENIRRIRSSRRQIGG